MTIEELLALMEDDGTDETWNIVMVVLPKILGMAYRFYYCRKDYACESALRLAFQTVLKTCNEDNAKYFIAPMAEVAFWLLKDAKGLSPETIQRLEAIRNTSDLQEHVARRRAGEAAQ